MQRRNIGSFVLAFSAVLCFSVAIFIWGLVLMADDKSDRILFVAGTICVVLSLLAGFIAMIVWTARQQAMFRMEQLMQPVNERLQHLCVLLDLVSEQQLISERAKAIAFREKDREALRRAIREEMNGRDFDAALALAAEIETVFGYKQEADQLRGEIVKMRDSDMRRDVTEAVAAIERFCRAEQWTLALREAERMLGLYPQDAQAAKLVQEVENRRQQHKKQLLDSWQDAVSRHDIDGSIAILKGLDQYLTPQEAAGMQETARQIFKDKLQLLGHQFTMAVREHQWAEAVRLGEALITEFPNSRMAQEVREQMALLREKAAEITVA